MQEGGIKDLIKFSSKLFFSENKAIREIQEKAFRYHQEIDQRRGGFPSFHNYYHVVSSVEGAIIFWQEADRDPENDPLGLRESLKKWNKNNQGDISFKELADILRLGFSLHDLGNIAEIEEREIILRRSGKYMAKNAEERSKQIAEFLIKKSNLIRREKQRYLPLVINLIEETKYDFSQFRGKEFPFALAVRVIDQIISGYLRRDNNFIQGLAIEVEEETGEKLELEKEDPDGSKFRESRLLKLLPDEERRRQVLKIIQNFYKHNIF